MHYRLSKLREASVIDGVNKTSLRFVMKGIETDGATVPNMSDAMRTALTDIE